MPKDEMNEPAGPSALSWLGAVLPHLLDLTGPVYVADDTGAVLFGNAAFQALLSDHPTIDDKLPTALMQRLLRDDGPVRTSVSVPGAAGMRHFQGRHRSLLQDGKTYFVGAFQDVTQTQGALDRVRELRARTEEVVSTVSDWVWQTNSEWNFVFSATRSGFVPGLGDSVRGRNLFDLGQVLKNPRMPRSRLIHPRWRASFRDVLYCVRTDEGGDRYILLSGIPTFHDETGVFEGFQGAGRDITGEMEAARQAEAYRGELETTLETLQQRNEELNTALERARLADEAKSSFLAMVGHELRTPLNAVIGFTEILKAQYFGPLGSERYEEYVGDILVSSRHLLGVINDIADVVKLEIGEIRLRLEPVGVAQALERSLMFVREKARSDGIALDFRAPAELLLVRADPRKLQQMLLNLLTNAVKFTPSGGTISVGARLRDAKQVEIFVSDTGVGVDDDDLETIFLPFKQADNSLERRYEGLGLGLPLTKSLIEVHGDHLELESRRHLGTTVRLIFPVASDPVDLTE